MITLCFTLHTIRKNYKSKYKLTYMYIGVKMSLTCRQADIQQDMQHKSHYTPAIYVTMISITILHRFVLNKKLSDM